MDALLVNGDEIELTPDPPWRWMVPPVRLKVTSLPSHLMKAKGEFVVWESEILQAGLLGAGQMYAAPGFDTPGSVLTVTLTVTPGTMSSSVKDVQQPVATVATSGTFIASVVPAVNPATGVPDPVVVKTGTWSVATNVQDVARSGQPPGNANDGEDEEGSVGSLGGANTSEGQANEDALHFVAVVIEDSEGNKLAEHRVAIATPDGRRTSHTLTDAGGARVDGIRAEGEAMVQLLDAQIRPRVPRPTAPWLALTVVDEDGEPLAGVAVEIETPDGTHLVRKTGAKGAVRVENLKQEGLCGVKLAGQEGAQVGRNEQEGDGDELDPSPPLGDSTGDAPAGPGEGAAFTTMLRLLDVSGDPLAGQTVTVADSEGTQVSVTSDDEGIIVFESASSGELTVVFDDAG